MSGFLKSVRCVDDGSADIVARVVFKPMDRWVVERSEEWECRILTRRPSTHSTIGCDAWESPTRAGCKVWAAVHSKLRARTSHSIYQAELDVAVIWWVKSFLDHLATYRSACICPSIFERLPFEFIDLEDDLRTVCLARRCRLMTFIPRVGIVARLSSR